MPNIKLAQRSAAFKACCQLYNKNELDDNLMPTNIHRFRLELKQMKMFEHWKSTKFINGKSGKCNFNNPFFNHKIFFLDNSRTAGTKSMSRIHTIDFPAELFGATPIPEQTSYLYLIKMCPEFDVSDTNEHYYKLLVEQKEFGILTSKQIPNIAQMKFSTSFGNTIVCIQKNPIEIRISDTESIQKLRNFHAMLFRDIMNIQPAFLAYDYRNREMSYLIVPTEVTQIDWNIVNHFQNLSVCKPRTEDCKKKKRTFIVDDYLHKVVSPWYRSDIDKRYIVIKVHEHLTPFSPFPSDAYGSYSEYITDKYQVSIENADQFMLEVKMITTHLNGLSSNASEHKSTQTRGPELLIPELCHNFEFPASLWLKATILPSILHRLQYLLNADRIRRKINESFTLINVNSIFQQPYEPWPVIEKMKKRPGSDAPDNIVPVRSIIIPNPEDTPAINIAHTDFVSLSNTIANPWREYEEPLDFDRHMQDIFQFEMDYYISFIKQKLADFKVSDIAWEQGKGKRVAAVGIGSANDSGLAICDSDDSDKRHIKWLVQDIQSDTKGPEQCDLLAALTAPSTADIFDMERFYVLGDSFMQFSIALYLMQRYPEWHLGFLMECHKQLIGNRNLCYSGIALNLANVIKVYSFNPKDDWVPPLMSVPSEIIVRF